MALDTLLNLKVLNISQVTAPTSDPLICRIPPMPVEAESGLDKVIEDDAFYFCWLPGLRRMTERTISYK